MDSLAWFFGDVLGMPRPTGLGLLAYLVPGLVLLAFAAAAINSRRR
jgi:hypothetical protein